MGALFVTGHVAAIATPSKSVAVRRMLVDTGPKFTWILEPILRKAGVTLAKSDVRFVLANGQTVGRSTGYAVLRASGFERVDEVVFGQPGDLPLLGARTLEGFGAVVDARKRRLAAGGPHIAALVMAAGQRAVTALQNSERAGLQYPVFR